MKMKIRLTIALMLMLMTVMAACQVPMPLPTPPPSTPGEVAVPFVTIALNDSGGDIVEGSTKSAASHKCSC